MKLAIVYAILATIATATNISSQEIAIRVYQGPHGVLLSVLVGTAVGLLVKYVLDKRFIFQFRARDSVHETQTFILYAAMGVFTTLLFWGFEFGFNYLFQAKQLRYFGGVLGLAIGYFTKYQLDKRFVFKASQR